MEPWYWVAVITIAPTVHLLFRHDFRGQDRIPPSGGVIIAANHVSLLDPFGMALYVHQRHRRPRFMAKVSLFRLPVAGRLLKGARQIPVYRDTADAGEALSAAVDAVRSGQCVVVYPDGTVTKDPAYWPMVGKTGVARLALATGAPVIPVAQWGAQHLLGRRGPRFFRRPKLHIWAGPPVDLSPWTGRPLDAETLRAATDRIVRTIADLLGEIRGESPPAVLLDRKAAGRGGAVGGITGPDEQRSSA